MLPTLMIVLISISFIAPIVLLVVYTVKAKRLKDQHDKKWNDLYDEIKDDPEALKLYRALSLMR